MVASGAINFPSWNSTPGLDGIFYGLHCRIARVSHNLEDLAHAGGGRLANESSPRDVVINCARSILFAPDIEQNKIAFTDGDGGRIGRLVVRIATVSVHGDDRRVVGDEVLAAKRFHEPALHVALVRSIFSDTPSDLLESCRGNAVNSIARLEMSLDLFVR